MMTRCEDVRPALGDLVDGDADAATTDAIEAHLAGCDACRGLAADLVRLRDAAASLGPVAPPDAVWARLEAARRTPGSGAWRQWVGLAAALVLITIGVYAVNRWTASDAPQTSGNARGEASVEGVNEELRLALDHYENAIGQLKMLVATGDDSLEPEVAATLDRNMAIIDEAILDSRAALSDDPSNQPARASLLEALSQKVNVLQATVLLMNAMGQGDPAGAAEAAARAAGKSS
jgi:hypothetical protein